MTDKLLPCPFCAGPASITLVGGHVDCGCAECKAYVFGDTIAEVKAGWNQRAVSLDAPFDATDYNSMSDADLISNLRDMAGLNHVGFITHLAANRLESLLSANSTAKL